MIYSRFGGVVTLLRPVTTTDEVELLTHEPADDHDVDRLAYGMYAERLLDLAMLRADNGINEINDTAKAVGCEPR